MDDSLFGKEVTMSDVKKKVCPVCGETFEAFCISQKYCSKKCRYISNHKLKNKAEQTLICERCGKPFTNAYGSQKYCSTVCRLIANDDRRKERKKLESPLREPINCHICGKPFVRKKGIQKYCSLMCSEKAKSLSNKKYQEKKRKKEK